MKKSGPLRSILMLLGGVIALLVAAVLIVSLVRIPIDLSGYKGLFESAAASVLGRTVKVDGDITVTTSLWPYFEIEGMRIANPEGFEAGDLATLKVARVRVGLLALLRRQIRIKTFRVDGLVLNLIREERGAVNWALGGPVEPDATQTGSATPETSQGFSPQALAVDELVLEGISATYRDGSSREALEFSMEKATGSAARGEPMELLVAGALLGEPFTLAIEANSLGEFLALTHSRLQLEVDIAESRLRFEGSSDALGAGRTSELEVSIEGERLDSLDALLGLDLPPLHDYRLAAHLTAATDRLELSDLVVRVRDSRLTGSAVVDRSGARPFATVRLSADTIQLDDFETGDWSPDGGETDATQAAAASPEQEPERSEAELLSPEALQRGDLKLDLRVAEVLSGNDLLGSGELAFELKDGRLTLDPLQLRIPGSSLLLRASVKPGVQASEASLRVLIEDFDFGMLMRLQNPDSDIGGTLDMDIDVTTSARGVNNLLAGADGYVDVAGHPENFRSGIVDLWAVNLLTAVVSESAEGADASQINCLISRWSLQDGVMTAQHLAADTSKIRICGQGAVDFNEQRFGMTVAPVAKRPEFFSLATPLVVEGSFDDFDIDAKGGALVIGTTAVKFAVSPLTTPVERLLREDLPRDGSDICGLPIGPHAGDLGDLPGCR